ncbi:hypothetical protein B0J14DRAFT_597133, partial [Halenospora varia]
PILARLRPLRPSGHYTRATLRTLQFLLAIIVAALYGVDLHNSTRTHTHANSAWVYAEVVAALSILTCAAHCFLTIRHIAWTAIDWVLFFLWVAQVGVFGTIYIGGEENGMVIDGSADATRRMRAAVWFDIVNMVLWFSTAMSGIVWCCVKRRVTRRADVVGAGEPEQSAEKGEMVESRGRDSIVSTLEGTYTGSMDIMLEKD